MPARPARATTPANLGDEARKLWIGITKQFELRPDELRILEDACRAIDVVERLEEEFEGSDTMVKGSMGQLVASPLLTELRQYRALIAQLLKKLNLPDEDGRQAESTSSAARKAANARWQRRGA